MPEYADIMKLGLLEEVNAPNRIDQKNKVKFRYRSLQECAASNYLTQTIEKASNIKVTTIHCYSWRTKIFTCRQLSCGKVMFSVIVFSHVCMSFC